MATATSSSVPEKFDCERGFTQEDAQKSFLRHGSIILCNVNINGDPWSSVAANVPNRVWGQDDLLLRKHRADAVHTEHEALKLQGLALPPHSDGYMWGDRCPDLVILVCEEPADNKGGANYLIDGHALLDQLPETTKDILENVLVDHTERGENNIAEGAESVVPVIRYLKYTGWGRKDQLEAHSHSGTKLCWRRMVTRDATQSIAEARRIGSKPPYTSLWAPPMNEESTNNSALVDALHELDENILSAECFAPRFPLKKGEALIVDNFRMLHARDQFLGSENKRRMWRVWSWTTESFGLPPNIKPSGDGVPGNVLEILNR